MENYTLSANTSRTIPKAFRDTPISQLFSSLRNNKLDIGFFTTMMDILGFTIGPLCLGPLSEFYGLSSLPINSRSVLTTGSRLAQVASSMQCCSFRMEKELVRVTESDRYTGHFCQWSRILWRRYIYLSRQHLPRQILRYEESLTAEGELHATSMRLRSGLWSTRLVGWRRLVVESGHHDRDDRVTSISTYRFACVGV